jgi:hypothetical protein
MHSSLPLVSRSCCVLSDAAAGAMSGTCHSCKASAVLVLVVQAVCVCCDCVLCMHSQVDLRNDAFLVL